MVDQNTGKETENDRFRSYCEKMGFRTDSYDGYDTKYGIDFIVSRVDGIHAAVNLAVRFTRSHRDDAAQKKVMRGVENGLATKALYIEVYAEEDTGAFPVAFAACVSCIFDQRNANLPVVGLRILANKNCQYFELGEEVAQVPPKSNGSPSNGSYHVIGQMLTGDIVTYVTDRGFGFIEEEEKETKFFFHIANVDDDPLQELLTQFKNGERIPVRFENGGVAPGKRYPKALVVVEDCEENMLEAS